MKEYIKNLVGFYKTNKEMLLKDYQQVKDVGGWEYNSPFELFIIVFCENKHSEELYNWGIENYNTVKASYDNFITDEIKEIFGIDSDLFCYFLRCYEQSFKQKDFITNLKLQKNG